MAANLLAGAAGRVLSIQSHTVRGYVGNKAATLPLQLHGFDVDPINSVQFSNHTGYAKGWRGDVLNGGQLDALVSGLLQNDLVGHYTHLLTGYIGSVSFLQSVLATLQTLKEACPDLIYFCDPVLGDKGKLYVPEELVQVYRDQVVPVASVLTPNQFELELLTGIEVNDLASARRALSALHDRGVGTVVLTSCEFGDSGDLLLLASLEGGKQVFRVRQPRIDGHFTGTGDLIAALLLARTSLHGASGMAEALREACASMHAVVKRTADAIAAGSNPSGELLLVQSRRDIERAPSSKMIEVESLE